ncbi:cobalamin biosynthesis protein CbiG [Anaerocolumna cellulosilytica]|uniref:Cobalamin biosynthesis protein CbiG n=1 Tax=Anaerocolumna cellulosilytica TaxID=433286 RepID=A0A6S6R4X8_9FIRM|nr:cobalt-precorrin 5A hydrolase [Anaerocolumna cellulosilytica]MBB5196371.1 cobalt-precorrin 5A hydrolase [Anaerocolumna cellulosilytica]BCJ96399.1 cobalamin biosynthesis protein CbiG [Anaerocolumna cellulosilytica]
MKQIAVISFTKKGAELNKKLCRGLILSDTVLLGFSMEKYMDEKEEKTLDSFTSIHKLMEELMKPPAEFECLSGLVFIGACGIAVRAIAPYIQNKAKDPAVAVVDEGGNYVISLLSGHLGGANELTKQVAAYIGAVPVITTATDTRKVFAVDSFAVKQALYITDTAKIKVISGALLNDEKIGIYSEYPVSGQLPAGLGHENQSKGICISATEGLQPFHFTMHLLPKNLIVGMGCKKGVEPEIMYNRLQKIFSEKGLRMERICKLCSVDIKKEEPGLLKLADKLGVDFQTYTVKELQQVSGSFTASAFVENTIGVDNVCERSAALGSGYGKQLIAKVSGEGMTLSVYEKEYQINF